MPTSLSIHKKLALLAGVIVTLAGVYSLAVAHAGEKVAVCHVTGSESSPIVEIDVSVNALTAHEGHGGDFVLEEGRTCEDGPADDDPEPPGGPI